MEEPVFMDEFEYLLPDDRIAAFPLSDRDASKLLVYKKGIITDDTFYHLPNYLPSDATLILNNTRVIEARLHFQKETGGIIEIFCLEPYLPAEVSAAMGATKAVQWRCLIGGASKWKPGQVLQKEISLGQTTTVLHARYLAKEADSFIIEFTWTNLNPFADVLAAAGAIPLPPYIKRKAEDTDANRYQTVFAEHKGSVAAPTAALHFTHEVFKKLADKNIHPEYLTLHVGAGTFKPVKTPTIEEHLMHAENFGVTMEVLKSLYDAQIIVAVGTTSLRSLESLYWLGVKCNQQKHLTTFTLEQWEAYELADTTLTYKESIAVLMDILKSSGLQQLWCRTSLLIKPGYRFRSANALVTNFHQPRSTLLLLIAAFIGDDWKRVYDHALLNNYRFLSYGDSSLLWRKD